jgi:uncharacterized HAD superfamily protein
MTDFASIFSASANRPNILVDIDNTLAWTESALLSIVNARFGLNIDMMTNKVYRIESLLTFDQGQWLREQMTRDIFYKNIAPDYEAINAVAEIKRMGYHVTVGTNRAPMLEDVTKQWLTDWNVSYDELFLGGRTNKPKFVQEHPNCIVIDDAPTNAIDLATLGASVWVPKRAYTPEWLEGSMMNVSVFDSWARVVEELSSR